MSDGEDYSDEGFEDSEADEYRDDFNNDHDSQLEQSGSVQEQEQQQDADQHVRDGKEEEGEENSDEDYESQEESEVQEDSPVCEAKQTTASAAAATSAAPKKSKYKSGAVGFIPAAPWLGASCPRAWCPASSSSTSSLSSSYPPTSSTSPSKAANLSREEVPLFPFRSSSQDPNNHDQRSCRSREPEPRNFSLNKDFAEFYAANPRPYEQKNSFSAAGNSPSQSLHRKVYKDNL